MRAPLELIADKAGVSMATASRVVNNQPNVASTTREKVLSAVRELAPSHRQTLLIGLVLPDPQNPMFTELAFELDRECERRNASLMIASSDGRADRELYLLERFISLGVDGILFISSGTGQSEALLHAASPGHAPPLVGLDRGVGGHDRVTVDSKKGTEQAVDHLVVFGHTRIGYLKGLLGTETAAERFESFQIAMAKNRLDVNPQWVHDGDYQPETGREFAEKLLTLKPADRPTAVLAANDLMALALMQRLAEAGWTLPYELSVIGFDDIPACNWVHPRLTTIAQPRRRLVREALNLLTRRIAEAASTTPTDAEPQVIPIEPELTPRASVDRPHAERTLQIVRGS
jgi:LacI family transcriptional regulator